MTTAEPGVTVVLPVFNGAKTLRQALASVGAQTVPGWRIVVVDDGSTDGSAAIAEAAATVDDRIHLLRRPHRGVSSARNAGIDAAATPWLLFLDADDWIAPQALELLLETADEHPEADCVYAEEWTIIPATGEPFDRVYTPDPSAGSMFNALSLGGFFPLHSAIVRTETVRAAGGFETELTTAEDWDLWLRVARRGDTFQPRPGVLAFYRENAESASAGGRRMLENELWVIDRAYTADPRVRTPATANRAGAPPDGRAIARITRTAYVAGLMIGRGDEATDDVFAILIEEVHALSVALEAVASELYHAVPRASGAGVTAWLKLSSSVKASLDEFLTALEQRTQINGAERRVRRALEARVFEGTVSAVAGSTTLGYTCAIPVELTEPLVDRELSAGLDRLYCVPMWRGRPLVPVSIPASDGFVPAAVLLDACVAENAWSLLESLLEEAGPLPGFAEVFATDGWQLFMRALWNQPDWNDAQFYDPKGARKDRAKKVRLDLGDVFVLEVLDALPDVICRGADHVDVELRIGGEPLWRLAVPTTAGRVTAQSLLVAVNNHGGFELCRAAVRRALQGRASGGGILRDALSAASDVKTPAPVSVVVGQRVGTIPGTAGSRAAVLPAAATDELIADARAQGEPVTEAPTGARVRYDPTLLGASAPGHATAVPVRPGEASSVVDRHFFESLYASAEDPWGYTSPYEVRKYEQTLALVPAEAIWALEVACAGGHFTQQLADKVGSVDAVDVSELALERARRRCAGLRNVSFRRADLFADALGSGYDVVICSEVLYYADNDDGLRTAIKSIARALRPGGALVTAHANVLVDDSTAPGFDWDDVPFGAAGIEKTILQQSPFRLERELRTDLYRVQRYRLEPARLLRRRRPPRAPEREVVEPASTLPASVRAAFRRQGGAVQRTDVSARAPGVPVLMYHRVSPRGSPEMRRWRVTPEELDAQLGYLRSAGYRSATLGELRTAVLAKRRLPARSVALTFDDGYADFEQHALPVVERHGFTATLFVVTDYVGGMNGWDQTTEAIPLMGWESLRRLTARGFDVGGHTATHRRLTALSDASVVQELARCRTALRRELGQAPTFFAAPYGVRDRGIDALVGACGFELGLTCQSALVTLSQSLLRLPRLEVYGMIGLDRYVALLGS